MSTIPSVPITITVPDANCCQQIICCSNGNQANLDAKRIVTTGDHGLEAEPAPGCMDLMLNCFRKVFCGRCLATPAVDLTAQNQAVLERYFQYLTQRYGEIPAKAAPILAGVNLDVKKVEGSPLHMRDVREIDQSAEEVVAKLEDMNLAFKRAKFYVEAHVHDEEESKAVGTSDVVVVDRAAGDALRIITEDGRTQAFREDKLKARVRDVTQDAPESQVDAIVGRVAERLRTQTDTVVPSDKIRSYVVEELKRSGLDVKRPPVMDQIRDPKGLAACRNIRELSPEVMALFFPKRAST